LTRQGEHAAFHFTAEEAWAALESVRAITAPVGLTPVQTFDAIRSYEQRGSVGARRYDRPTGKASVAHFLELRRSHAREPGIIRTEREN
jgi:hypothetical protein